MTKFKHTRIAVYNKASNSAAALSREMTAAFKEADGDDAKALRISYVKADSKYRGRKGRIVINWGCSEIEDHVKNATIINAPEAISAVSNKLSFFRKVSDACRTVAWSTSKAEVLGWVGSNARPDYPFAMARTKLQGHSGAGIVPLFSEEDVNNLKAGTLVTKYQPKKSEWRVHFMSGQQIFLQNKVRRREVEDPNWVIRNHENGFNYANGEEYTANVPEDVIHQAKLAFDASELDFGAVDVIYNRGLDQAFVLEINSAPGLEGSTLDTYVKNFLKLVEKS